MIVEMQTYDLKSRSASIVEARFREALDERTKLSRLGAFWHTEVGPLNRIILVWPYEDLETRRRVQAEETGVPGWPPQIEEFVVGKASKVLALAPFSPPIEPRRLGRLYEIRSYVYPTQSIPAVLETWSESIAERIKLSPLVGAWYAERGADASLGQLPVSDWIHVWAYRDAGERERIREAASKAGIWPMSVIDRRLKREPRGISISMQNMLVVPASFSPLQ